MVDWRDFLTDDERNRLDELKAENRKIKAEHRRIYDRCRKRMAKDWASIPLAYVERMGYRMVHEHEAPHHDAVFPPVS